MKNNIAELFLKTTNKFTTKTVYKYKINGNWTELNYIELKEKVSCLALGLLSLGIRPKDRVGIVSENRIEWIISSLAITLIGAVDVPIFPTLSPKQEEFIFNDCSASAIFVSNKFQMNKLLEVKENIPSLRHIIVMNEDFQCDDVAVENLSYVIKRGKEVKDNQSRERIIEDLASKIKLDDLLTIIYTSGTTGNPKGVMLTHKNVLTNICDIKEVVKIDETHTFLSFLPYCHSYERTTGFYTALLSGSTIALAESIETIASNIKEIKPSYITTVPKLLETIKKKIFLAMEKEPSQKRKIFNWAVTTGVDYIRKNNDGKVGLLSSMKYKLADKLVFKKLRDKIGVESITFISGGAALAPDVCEFFLAAGFTVLEGYGLTEASPVVSVNYPNDIEPGTVGKPLKSVEVKLASDGEILVKAPSVMLGYWNDENSTAASIDENGWLYTGDIGILTERKNIKITDRKKHILVSSGGKNIAPQPIENLLSQSPYIEQCFLVGDKREYCTALITPDFEQLKLLAGVLNIEYNEVSELIANKQIVQAIKKDIDRLQKDLAKFERVRKFSLLSQPFTVENGELSPKLSVKRHIVERKYSDLIEQMYGEIE